MVRRNKKKQEDEGGQIIKIEGKDLPLTLMRQADSVGVLLCPQCKIRWYIPEPLMKFYAEVQQSGMMENVLTRHQKCGQMMDIYQLPDNLPPPLTEDDLSRIYFRTKFAPGDWRNVNALEATDGQFDAWITEQIEITGEPGVWLPEERVVVCDLLQQRGQLRLIKND